MSLTFSPIGPWLLVAIAAIGVLGVTLWAYRPRVREAHGAWRWVVVGLRLVAIALCLMACLRPSVVLLRKVKQTAALVFLLDGSESMAINDEANNRTRWEVARETMNEAVKAVKKRLPDLEVKTFLFDSHLRDDAPPETRPPKGKATELGTAFDETLKRMQGTRIAALALLSDGASNGGPSPLDMAARLKQHQVPIVAIGFGSESGGAASRDLSARELVAGPTVFVKNELQVRATVGVRGYPNQDIDVELVAENQAEPVAKTKVRAKEGADVITIDSLKYTPQVPGEVKLTLRVRPKDGELIQSNNQIETYVTVLKGGISVLYVQGPGSPWEKKFTMRALDAAREIQADLRVLFRPAQGDQSELDIGDLARGKFDVYILGDLPADYLTAAQERLIARNVEQGAGLIMLGGRSSFGPGGWGGSPLADILPTTVQPTDGQAEPPQGIKVVPNLVGLDNYVLRLAPSRAETQRAWETLPPLSGANDLGKAKAGAFTLAEAPNGSPLMIGQDVGKGRVLEFAGETWVWARDLIHPESRAAHRKFWRQAILWLAHKEDQGGDRIKVELDRRRIALGEKLDVKVTVRDEKDQPIPDAKLETTVEYLGPGVKPERLDVFNQGAEAHGTYYATREPGEYKVTVRGSHRGTDLGSDSVRFLVYQDDRELENPAADRALLRQLASITGGKSLPPEQLDKYIASLGDNLTTEYVRQTEYRAWDNWPFFLLFVLVLSLEWVLRKRKGLV
ncbi:MAG TPA: glutamine amidotransferase [Isosphaeraceae bacterium]|jgi:hypothetical protein|nr:glutamine amidotransferase [Isosphaeraceae bacterium]